ncbi:SDR family NAD(P)-dependent oxidoreductase [Cytophagaceae bacterium ABcell3]|nr:SDR family NAD(P)-dependent oxidoreductase [Cytophagaceae bacterium ABcell3]
MVRYFITGASRGLGKAMALELLDNPQSRVTGISRKQGIMHDHYSHITLDLADSDLILKTAPEIFETEEGLEKIVLINNAGTLGQVGYLGSIESENMQRAINVNLTSPAILVNEFIKAYRDLPVHKTIINISTGAAKQPVDGWSAYCSSKAGLDMLAQVGAKESKFHKFDIRHYAVSPGILDTDMQSEIRTVNKEDFSRIDEFIEYKKENMLVSPEKVASQLLQLLDEEDKVQKPLVSVREL